MIVFYINAEWHLPILSNLLHHFFFTFDLYHITFLFLILIFSRQHQRQQRQAKTIQDAENEQKVFDKYACWCEKTTQRKATAIETAKTAIQKLGNEVLSSKGKVATLAWEIAKAQADIKANEEAQAAATSVRQKENSDFSQEKAEMEQTLNALERAIKVLAGEFKVESVPLSFRLNP